MWSNFVKKNTFLLSGHADVYYMGVGLIPACLWLLSGRLRLDFPLGSFESECETGACCCLLSSCGPSGRQRGMGNLGCKLLIE